MANAWIEGKFSARMSEKMCTLRIADRTYKIGTTKMHDLSSWLQIEANKVELKEHSVESEFRDH